MRRLIQIGTILFLAVTLLTPLLEFFDRWDTPEGLFTDTEFAVFAFVFALCLVLVVTLLLCRLALRIGVAVEACLHQMASACEIQEGNARIIFHPPAVASPLRI